MRAKYPLRPITATTFWRRLQMASWHLTAIGEVRDEKGRCPLEVAFDLESGDANMYAPSIHGLGDIMGAADIGFTKWYHAQSEMDMDHTQLRRRLLRVCGLPYPKTTGTLVVSDDVP